MWEIRPTHCALLHIFSSVSPCFLQNMTCSQYLTPVPQPCAESSLKTEDPEYWCFGFSFESDNRRFIPLFPHAWREVRRKDIVINYFMMVFCVFLCFLFFFFNIRAVAEYVLVTSVSTILKTSSSGHYSAMCHTNKKKLLFICWANVKSIQKSTENRTTPRKK